MTVIVTGATISGGVTITGPTIITSGLVLYWDIQNASSYSGSGSTITDLSGAGNNGTISGATYASGALTTGTSKYIYTAPSFNLGTGGIGLSWTMTVVSNTSLTQPQYWSVLWGDEAWSSNGYLAYQSAANVLVLGSPASSITYNPALASAIQGSNTVWDFTYDGTTLNLYKNGVTTPVVSGAVTAIAASSAGIFFGARHVNGGGASPTDFSATTFYQMRVYNRALSSAEVNANYDVVKTRYPGLGLP